MRVPGTDGRADKRFALLGRYSSEIRSGCANECPSGSVRGAPGTLVSLPRSPVDAQVKSSSGGSGVKLWSASFLDRVAGSSFLPSRFARGPGRPALNRFEMLAVFLSPCVKQEQITWPKNLLPVRDIYALIRRDGDKASVQYREFDEKREGRAPLYG
jgi:hypothetical protein